MSVGLFLCIFDLFVAFVWLVLVILRKVGSGLQTTMWCAHDGMAGWDVLFVVDGAQDGRYL